MSNCGVVIRLVLILGSLTVFGLKVLGVRLRLVMAISLVVNSVIMLGVLHLVSFVAVACLRLGDLATSLPLSSFNVHWSVEFLDHLDGRRLRQLDL